VSVDHLPSRQPTPPVPAVTPTAPVRSPRPMQSMTAAAAAITGRQMRRTTSQAWQTEAWNAYDSVGELRFVANTLASAASRARIFAARLPQGADDPEPLDVETDVGPVEVQAREAVEVFGGGTLGRSEVLRRLLVQLFVPGDGWLVGLRAGLLDLSGPREAPEKLDPRVAIRPEGKLTIDQLTWHALSVEEIRVATGGKITLNVGDGSRDLDPDEVMLIRVWQAHPRRWWEADSPVRANLPVLRELIGLTKHVGATIDSRLAGAGILVVGNSVEVVGNLADGETPVEDPQDEFVAALIDSMVTPILDRDSAAAVVPLVVKVPDETVDKIKHIRFSTDFDKYAKDLRDEAIRRLALGLDAPPETLLGLGSTNHWSAWQIEESTVKTHIEPKLALVCDALTTDYLWPVLHEAGVSEEEAREFVVWFDTTDMTLRPNRSEEAGALYDRGELTGDALRREAGFDSTDGPRNLDRATDTALRMMTQMPSLAEVIGVMELIDILREAIEEGEAIAEGEEIRGSRKVHDPTGPEARKAVAEVKRQEAAERRAKAREATKAKADGGTPDTQGQFPKG
jgi:hypothetical protein